VTLQRVQHRSRAIDGKAGRREHLSWLAPALRAIGESWLTAPERGSPPSLRLASGSKNSLGKFVQASLCEFAQAHPFFIPYQIRCISNRAGL